MSRPVPSSTPSTDVCESLAEAVASSRLEGLEPTDEFLADAAAFVSGELDEDELLDRAVARHRK
jgi:hypothetical protein